MVKNPPAMWETWVGSLGWEDPLEKGMVTHSSILAWRISMDRGPWRATVEGLTKSRTWLSNKAQGDSNIQRKEQVTYLRWLIQNVQDLLKMVNSKCPRLRTLLKLSSFGTLPSGGMYFAGWELNCRLRKCLCSKLNFRGILSG